MASHMWGDEDFNWAELHRAADFISEYYNRYTADHLMLKEKYGSLRYETVHIFPDVRSPCLANAIYKFRRYVLRRAIFKAVKMFPTIEDEILQDAPEDVVGSEIHSRYWEQL